MFGETQFAPFAISHAKINRSTSFTVDAGSLAANNEFAIQDSYIIAPSLSSVVDGTSVKVTVAVREGADDEGLIIQAKVPTAQPLTLGPKIASAQIALKKAATTKGPAGFALWEGSVGVDRPTGAVSVRLVRDGETLDTLLLDGGIAGW